MQSSLSRKFVASVVFLGAVGLAGCGSEGLPTGNEVSSPPRFAVGDVTTSVPELGKLKICKVGDISGDFDVSRVAVGASSGTVQANGTIAAGTCVVVAEDNGGNGVGSTVTFAESPATYLTGVTGQKIDVGNNISTACGGTPDPCNNPGTVSVNSFHGYTFTFTNVVPPPGGEGCSPGYWKTHTGAGKWPAPRAPTDLFSSVFENAFPGQTLLQVVGNHGGGLNALGRQTVSALLNAGALPGFELTQQQVIDRFNAVFPGSKAAYNTLKDEFEALIDVDGRICPLN